MSSFFLYNELYFTLSSGFSYRNMASKMHQEISSADHRMLPIPTAD